jgi:hypothetical protein
LRGQGLDARQTARGIKSKATTADSYIEIASAIETDLLSRAIKEQIVTGRSLPITANYNT